MTTEDEQGLFGRRSFTGSIADWIADGYSGFIAPANKKKKQKKEKVHIKTNNNE